ncbi:MAG: leucine-rich repeat domain-containing protein [Bacteroidales bacterium]|nr:leucine-rich repeat domain-containing protein [Bacteroidales bacterium]
MTLKKQICSLLALVLMPILSYAYDFEADGIYYNINSNSETVSVTYKGFDNDSYVGDIDIPSKVTYNSKTYTVTEIGERAFQRSSIISVIISNSVTKICEHAFFDCNDLISVTIPESVTMIGDFAFNDCRDLPSITIPNSVTVINVGTFSGCFKLKSVTMGNSVTEIMYNAFHICRALTDIVIPDSVKKIGLQAFINCESLTSIVIPDSVTEIDDYAFYACSGLNTVTIGKSVNSIGTGVFQDCNNLKLLNWNASSYPDFPNAAFAGCPISSVIIGDDVTAVPNDFFKDNTSIKNITIGEQVESFGTNALAGCTGIKSVTWKPINYTGVQPFPTGITPTNFSFGNSVETIPDFLCYGYSDISSIALPPSVKTIGDMAFYGCNPTKVTCRAAVPPTISETTFSQSAYDAPLFVYESSEDEYLNHEIWRNFYDTQFLAGGAVEEPVSLSILFPDRGEVAVEVPYNKTTTVKVFPDNVDGYRLSSVTFNGEDILDSLDADHRYTTPKLTADALISVVYVSDKGSVDQTVADSIRVSASSGTVRIMGAAPESVATVCDLSGNIVRKTAEKTFTLDKGIYILTVEGISFKFAL